LIRHALRSAVKRGDADALAVLGFEGGASVDVSEIEIAPERAQIGDTVRIAFTVTNPDGAPTSINADLRIHFVKSNGTTSPKVFKVRGLGLGAGESQRLSKLVSLRQHTTRSHYPGVHRVEVVLNGVASPIGSFAIVG